MKRTDERGDRTSYEGLLQESTLSSSDVRAQPIGRRGMSGTHDGDRGVATIRHRPRRWPDIAIVPHRRCGRPSRGRLFRRAVRAPTAARRRGRRTLLRRRASIGDPVMRLVRPASFFHRVGATGTIGFGEAYMAGDWVTEDLAGVLSAFAANMRDLVPAVLQRLRHAVLRRQPGPTTTPSRAPGRTSTSTTTCPTTCSGCSSTRR